MEIRGKATSESTVKVIKWDLVKEVNRELSKSSTRLNSGSNGARLEQGENFIFIFPPRHSRCFGSKPAEEKKAGEGRDASWLRGNKVIILGVDISPSSIIVLHEFFLQDKKIFDHVIFEAQCRVGESNSGVQREIRTPSYRLCFSKIINGLTLKKKLNRKPLKKVDSLGEGDIAKFKGLGASKLEIEEQGFMPRAVATLKGGISCRSPSGPEQKELGKSSRGGFPLTPLCARGKGSPFYGWPQRRSSGKDPSSSSINGIGFRLTIFTRRRKVEDRGIIRRKALFLRGINLSFGMIPESKESTGPGLNIKPGLLGFNRKLIGKDEACPRALRPVLVRDNSCRSLFPQVSKVRALKKKVGSISTIMLAVRTLGRFSLLHKKESVRSTMCIGKESFEYESIRMLSPLLMESRSVRRRSTSHANPGGRGAFETRKKRLAICFTHFMLKVFDAGISRIPNKSILVVLKSTGVTIKTPLQQTEVIKQIANRPFARLGGVMINMMKEDLRASMSEKSNAGF